METIDEIKNEAEMSVGDWVLTIFITALPVIGLVMLFVWAFGGSAPKVKSNWAKANLIWMILGFAIAMLFIMTIGFGALMGTLSGQDI